MSFRTIGLALFPLVAVIASHAACVGSDATAPPGDTTDGGPGGGADGGPGGGDGSVPGPDGSSCAIGTPVCLDGKTLGACGSDQPPTTCALECSSDGVAHCTVLQPQQPVTPADLAAAGVVDVDITADGFVDTDTGAIDGVRAANADAAASEVKSGVGYRLVGNVGVFTVKSLKVESGATWRLRGAAAAAFVAADGITIIGVVDARGYDSSGNLCAGNVAGPGGTVGALPADANNGSSKGAGGAKGVAGFTGTEGPGGGGFGAAGGDGGGYAASGGAAVAMPSPIAGGFGGAASVASGGTYDGIGGGGGGAVQLVAGAGVTIGGGANPGGINVGGCGGYGAAFGNTGAGGGSGGAILVQAPTITIAANGVLAANGGAGSTGNASGQGGNGALSATRAIGSAAVSGYGKGGDGGGGSVLPGDAGGTGATRGGAGGGAVGRIRLEDVSGSVSPVAGAVVSPVIATGAGAATTVGEIQTK